MNINNLSFYKNKNILITGHTGFKGTWLSWWLKELGANVTGIALPPEDIRGNLYNLTNLKNNINSIYGDIGDISKNNIDNIKNIIKTNNIEIIFHLAAQPLVLESYNNPVNTYQTNVMGTVNILEAARFCDSIKNIVVITTDKCYENLEHSQWFWPYRETDKLGGHDPYSSSKAMTELAARSYYKSFLKNKNIGLATARAGNVIGGGDFAQNRIIPDIVDAIKNNQVVTLRNPNAIRPWQYVLDALYGYLLLGINLDKDQDKLSTAFNFSPNNSNNISNITVETITKLFINNIKQGSYIIDSNNTMLSNKHEASMLKLDSSKAKSLLNWQCKFTEQEAILESVKWYQYYLSNNKHLQDLTIEFINNYSTKVLNTTINKQSELVYS